MQVIGDGGVCDRYSQVLWHFKNEKKWFATCNLAIFVPDIIAHLLPFIPCSGKINLKSKF
jgi:hypothetical protein